MACSRAQRLVRAALQIARRGSSCSKVSLRMGGFELIAVKACEGHLYATSYAAMGRSLGQFVDVRWDRRLAAERVALPRHADFHRWNWGRLELPVGDSDGMSERREDLNSSVSRDVLQSGCHVMQLCLLIRRSMLVNGRKVQDRPPVLSSACRRRSGATAACPVPEVALSAIKLSLVICPSPCLQQARSSTSFVIHSSPIP